MSHQLPLILSALSALPCGGATHRLRAFVIATLLACVGPNVHGQTPGALDLSFDTGSEVDSSVQVVVPAGDGKVYVGGLFSTVRGAVRGGLARLNTDGTVDGTFLPAPGISHWISFIAVQPDGKLLVGGSGTEGTTIARLNSDGSLDPSFNPAPPTRVVPVVLQADGKVLVHVHGQFSGSAGQGIARLNSDGSLDTSFQSAPLLLSNSIDSVAVQTDGKVLIGGHFSSYNGTPRNGIVRLNGDGSLDTSFNPGTEGNYFVHSVAVQSDGKVLIGGSFYSRTNTRRNPIERLNSDGSLDTTFNPGTGANSAIECITMQADGKILIGGWFSNYNGTERNCVARLNTDGSLDLGFNPGAGASAPVESIALHADGTVLIGGGFSSYDGTARSNVAQVRSDGRLDMSFNPGAGANSVVHPIAVQTDGKVLIGGDFGSYNGTGRKRVARLYSDGRLDASFNPGTGADKVINSIAVQADGRIFVGGEFTSYNGMWRNRIARLNNDGSLDTSFDPSTGANGRVRPIALQTDGRVLIGGGFTSYNGTDRNRIARLNSDGSLDTSFNPGTGVSNNPVECIAVQLDGKVLIGGGFTSYDGTGRNRIARLNSDGTLDMSFNPNSGSYDTIWSIAVQADGKVLIGTYYNFTMITFARLNGDGSLDPSFNPGTAMNNYVFSVVLQGDGKALVSGWFRSTTAQRVVIWLVFSTTHPHKVFRSQAPVA